MASLKLQVETRALAGAREAGEVARQLGALESAQHVTGAEVAAARAQLRLLSDGLAQANIALADVQDTLEESGMALSSRYFILCGRLGVSYIYRECEPSALYGIQASFPH